MKIVLIGCGAKKLPRSTEAMKLYCGRHFQALRDYAISTGHPWMILSSLYGLVQPGRNLQPYDLRITQMSKRERERWAEEVLRLVQQQGVTEVELLAGNEYARDLVPMLEWKKISVTRPLRGMAIGKQYQWLRSHTKGEIEA